MAQPWLSEPAVPQSGPDPAASIRGRGLRTDQIRAMGIQLYAEDEANLHLEQRGQLDRRLPRAERIDALLLNIPIVQLQRVRDRVVSGDRIDEALLGVGTRAAVELYALVTRFAWAHCLGRVSRAWRARRATICEGCTYRQRRVGETFLPTGGELVPDDYCTAGGCGGRCPTAKWWRPSTLRWRIRLYNETCPANKWPSGGRGPFVLMRAALLGVVVVGLAWVAWAMFDGRAEIVFLPDTVMR